MSGGQCWANSPPPLTFLNFFLLLLGEKDVIVLGDFGQGPDSSDYDILRKEKFHHLIPAHTFTNISTKNPQGSKTLDNIWISKSIKKVFTGKARVLFRNRVGVTCLSWQFTIVWFERVRSDLPSSAGIYQVSVQVAV